MRRVLLSNSQILTKTNTVKMPGRFKETSLAHQGQGVGTEEWRTGGPGRQTGRNTQTS